MYALCTIFTFVIHPPLCDKSGLALLFRSTEPGGIPYHCQLCDMVAAQEIKDSDAHTRYHNAVGDT